MALSTRLAMIEQAEDYYWKMAAMRRLVLVDNGLTAYMTFFVLNDTSQIDSFHTRHIWSVPKDYIEGSIIYIDKLLAKEFNLRLFHSLERAITSFCPNWQIAVWFRPGQEDDRMFTYHRRSHGANLHS